MSYAVWDISDWQVMSQEARGLDPKDWIVRPGETASEGQAHWWLFKPVKAASYRRFDDYAEKIAAELAALIGLPSARVELVQGVEDFGIISANVTPDGWNLESGDTILSDVEGYVSCVGDDRPKDRVGHNLPNVIGALRGCSGSPSGPMASWEAAEVFAGFLVFDAWIANTDRHAINWGVVTRDTDGQKALAPSFDHGSALASGYKEDGLAEADAAAYAARGFAHRFEGGRRLPLVELGLAAVEQVGGRAPSWVDRLSAVSADDVSDILGSIPEMSVARRMFLSTLLETNRRRLSA